MCGRPSVKAGLAACRACGVCEAALPQCDRPSIASDLVKAWCSALRVRLSYLSIHPAEVEPSESSSAPKMKRMETCGRRAKC